MTVPFQITSNNYTQIIHRRFACNFYIICIQVDTTLIQLFLHENTASNFAMFNSNLFSFDNLIAFFYENHFVAKKSSFDLQ